MAFLLGVLVGGLLVCLPLVVIVLTARWQGDELEAVALAEMQMRSIKRETITAMFRVADQARGGAGVGGLLDADDVVES